MLLSSNGFLCWNFCSNIRWNFIRLSQYKQLFKDWVPLFIAREEEKSLNCKEQRCGVTQSQIWFYWSWNSKASAEFPPVTGTCGEIRNIVKVRSVFQQLRCLLCFVKRKKRRLGDVMTQLLFKVIGEYSEVSWQLQGNVFGSCT